CRELVSSGGWILEREIPGVDARDGMSVYPLLVTRQLLSRAAEPCNGCVLGENFRHDLQASARLQSCDRLIKRPSRFLRRVGGGTEHERRIRIILRPSSIGGHPARSLTA